MSVTDTANDIRDTFSFLDDWETRYEHIIDLGKGLPDLSEADKTEPFRVRGCASQVWIVPEPCETAGHICFRAQSDAILVSGLIAILTDLFYDQPADEILSFDAKAFFSEIGLDEALSAQRSNGLHSMVARIHELAEARQSAG